MKRSNITWNALIAITLGLLFMGSAYADEMLQPNEAYTIKDGNHLAVIYFTPVAHGYQVVTSWVVAGGAGSLARNTAYIKPGQHYALSLRPAGVAARLAVQGHADSVSLSIEHPRQVACAGHSVAQSASASGDQHRSLAAERYLPMPVTVAGSMISLDHHFDKVSLLSGR